METLSSKDALRHLAESNPKWIRYRDKAIIENLVIAILFGMVLIFIQNRFFGDFTQIFAVYKISNIYSYLFGKLFSLALLFATGFFVITTIQEIWVFLTKAMKYKRRGIGNRPVYYSIKNGFTPFKKDSVSSKKLPKVVPIEDLVEIPERIEKNTLYFCNNVKLRNCLVEDGYFGFPLDVGSDAIQLTRFFWKKMGSDMDEVEKEAIRERLMKPMTVRMLFCRKQKNRKELPHFYILDWGEPIEE